MKQNLAVPPAKKDEKTKTVVASKSSSSTAVIGKDEWLYDDMVARLLVWIIQNRLDAAPLLNVRVICRYPLHEKVMASNLRSPKSKLSIACKEKGVVIFQALNVMADQASYLKPTASHVTRGNHWVALVIDTRSEACFLSNSSLQTWSKHPSVFPFKTMPRKQPYRGLVVYWDSKGNRMFSPELRTALQDRYPDLLLIEVNEYLQDDGIQCPIWVTVFFHCYLDHLYTPPKNNTLCTILSMDTAKDLRRLTSSSTRADVMRNQAYIQHIRAFSSSVLSRTAADSKEAELSLTRLLHENDFA